MYNSLFSLLLILSFQNTVDDPEIKNLVWNRYVTSNFTILSIDNDQGQWMRNNLENIKIWCLTRWGLPDIKFSKECRIFCVPNHVLLKKLFNLDDSKVEIRRKDGAIEITAMWLALDDKPAKVLPIHLTEIVIAEFEEINKFKFAFWAKKGIAALNGVIPDIKNDLSSLKDAKLMSLESLLNFNQEQFLKLSAEKQKIFIDQSVCLCLLLRKEFGEVKLHSFLKKSYQNGSNEAVQKVLGFVNVEDFEKTYSRYVSGLSKDILEKATPDSYLQIKKAER